MPKTRVSPQQLLERRRAAPESSGLLSPVQTRVHELPFDQLTWKAFEHLCLALVDLDERVELGHMYGVEGEDQDGIDLFGERLDNDHAIVFQCKRVEEFGPARIRRMVDKFLGKTSDGQPLKDKHGQPIPVPVDDQGSPIEPWHQRADTFVLCISRPLNTTLQQNAWRQARNRLKMQGIKAELWDPSVLGRKLRNAPEIVDIYFSRPWVVAFCGAEAAAGLGHLQENDRAALRKLLETAEGMDSDLRFLRTEGVHLSTAAQTGAPGRAGGLQESAGEGVSGGGLWLPALGTRTCTAAPAAGEAV